jgi:hypothetical protein
MRLPPRWTFGGPLRLLFERARAETRSHGASPAREIVTQVGFHATRILKKESGASFFAASASGSG